MNNITGGTHIMQSIVKLTLPYDITNNIIGGLHTSGTSPVTLEVTSLKDITNITGGVHTWWTSPVTLEITSP